jgi:hypothetical protein
MSVLLLGSPIWYAGELPGTFIGFVFKGLCSSWCNARPHIGFEMATSKIRLLDGFILKNLIVR